MNKQQTKINNNKASGFTLIELIVVLLLGSILLAWGVPNYRQFKVRKDVSMNANEIAYSFNLARAEAIRYGTDVIVRLSGATWSDGWEIWTLDETNTEDVQLFIQQPINQLSLTQTGGTAGELVFNSIGALEGGVSVQFDADNSYQPVPDSQRNILVTPSGSVRVVKP